MSKTEWLCWKMVFQGQRSLQRHFGLCHTIPNIFPKQKKFKPGVLAEQWSCSIGDLQLEILPKIWQCSSASRITKIPLFGSLKNWSSELQYSALMLGQNVTVMGENINAENREVFCWCDLEAIAAVNTSSSWFCEGSANRGVHSLLSAETGLLAKFTETLQQMHIDYWVGHN